MKLKNTIFARFLSLSLVVLLISIMLFSFAACDENDNGQKGSMTADVNILVIDKNDLPIADTEIYVQGISDREIVEIYTTDPNGRFTVKNLGERTITAAIHTESASFQTSYTITKSDLEKGEITIQFSSYEKQS